MAKLSTKTIQKKAFFFFMILCILLASCFRPEPVMADNLFDQLVADETRRNEVETLLEELLTQIDVIANEKDNIQGQYDILTEQIAEYQRQIEAYDMEIIQCQDLIDAAQSEFDDRMLAYTTRIRAVEEYGTSFYWAILFQATNVSDLLGRFDYVTELVNADEEAIDMVNTQIESLDEQHAYLEGLRADRQYAATQLQYAQNELSKTLDARIRELGELGDEASEILAELEELKEEIDVLKKLVSGDESFIGSDPDAIYYKYVVLTGDEERYPNSAAAVKSALQHIGEAYVWGGESYEEGGFDCSGLMYYVFQGFGIQLQRVAASQFYADGTLVENFDDYHCGDLIFFHDTYTEGVSHVGMYISNGLFVHAAGTAAGIKVSSLYNTYYGQHLHGAKRIVEG